MSPFTRFFGRLVELTNPECAAALVNEFGGKTVTFPASSVYQIPVVSEEPKYDVFGQRTLAPMIGEALAPTSSAHKTTASAPSLQCPLGHPSSKHLAGNLLTVANQLAAACRELQRLASLRDQAPLPVPEAPKV